MKTSTLLVFALCVFATADPIDYYVFDNTGVDIEGLFAAPLSLKSYIDCHLDKGPCNNVGESYKKHFAEAVAQSCRRCSPEQKTLFWRFIEVIRSVFPTEYKEFWAKYDPEHKYFDSFMKELYKYRTSTPIPLPIPSTIPKIQI